MNGCWRITIETEVDVITVAEDGKMDVRPVQSNEILFNIPRMPKKQHGPPATKVDETRKLNQLHNCLNNKSASGTSYILPYMMARATSCLEASSILAIV
jgi:hypothetical protein